MRRSDYAWLALATGIAVYDLTAAEDQTLSAAVRRYQRAHPMATRLAINAVSWHLLGDLVAWADPVALATMLLRRWRRPTVIVVDGVYQPAS